MRYQHVYLSLFLLFAPFLLSAHGSEKATLEITFTGMRSSKGKLAIGINDSPEGWPYAPLLEPNWLKEKNEDGTMTVTITDLAYGTYAVSALDDENGNLEMDKSFGIPKEGYGFSRDAKVGMGPPKFEDCAIEIDEPLVKITITIRYFGKSGK